VSGPHLDFPFDPQRAAASLVRADHPALHAPTEPVTRFDADLVTLLERMRTICAAADGVGLAANQLGLSAAVAIVWLPPESDGAARPAPIELVNPRLLSAEGEVHYEMEGCLSLPCLHGRHVLRPERISLEADDRHGHRRHIEAAGFMAEILSHEIDHLNGLLYPERAARLVWTPGFRIRGVR
jgi:peptide deformylase